MLQTTTLSTSSHARSTVTSTTDIGGAGGYATTTPAGSSNTSTGAGSSSREDGADSATTGAIAGGVVGGAAGIALLLVAALLFLKWWRRNRMNTGHQALPANSGMSAEGDHPTDFSRGPGMAERAGMMPAALAAVPALFRHHDRSAPSTESEPSERGFTRVSGRKLPSNFSPGMTGPPPPDMPLSRPDRNLSGTSFYRDSGGFYGGESFPPEDPAPIGAGAMTLSPGPQRRPTVHAGGPYRMSSRRSPGAAMFDRSDTPSSLDPNRSSRFQENVDM
ncbi:hypothetical protein Tdes44962_MAKER07522 [Teratosphaeria destructans]|uniref:Uncharacterized protein n=1 Tax=Teratosphaeria destructans TaxID=418781 RepID=A0A9W7SZ76_9PEZI|nr:hypothetical protein Tdes44962_MAKER07522 [Teratosphaeria destructans]